MARMSNRDLSMVHIVAASFVAGLVVVCCLVAWSSASIAQPQLSADDANRLSRVKRRVEALNTQIRRAVTQAAPLRKKLKRYESRLTAAESKLKAAEADVKTHRLEADDARSQVDAIRIELQADVEGSADMLALKRRWAAAESKREDRRQAVLDKLRARDDYLNAVRAAQEMHDFVEHVKTPPPHPIEVVTAAEAEAARRDLAVEHLSTTALQADAEFVAAEAEFADALKQIQSRRDAATPPTNNPDYTQARDAFFTARRQVVEAEQRERAARASVAAAHAVYRSAPPAVQESRRELLILKRNLDRLQVERIALLQEQWTLDPSSKPKPKAKKGKRKKKGKKK